MAEVDQLKRQAAVARVGGFRPPDDPRVSWAGGVGVARPKEEWPTTEGEPMLALVQINVGELPVLAPALAGLALLTLFIGPGELPIDVPNGSGWCLRAYETLDGLAAVDVPKPARAVDTTGAPATYKRFPVQWDVVEDWPTYDDVPPELSDVWDEVDEDELPNAGGLKVGGWPTCVQSELEWEELGDRLDDVEFAFQVESDDKTGFAVGYGGVLYIGRSARGWHATWQSM